MCRMRVRQGLVCSMGARRIKHVKIEQTCWWKIMCLERRSFHPPLFDFTPCFPRPYRASLDLRTQVYSA